jgi:hypothetical protein
MNKCADVQIKTKKMLATLLRPLRADCGGQSQGRKGRSCLPTGQAGTKNKFKLCGTYCLRGFVATAFKNLIY